MAMQFPIGEGAGDVPTDDLYLGSPRRVPVPGEIMPWIWHLKDFRETATAADFTRTVREPCSLVKMQLIAPPGFEVQIDLESRGAYTLAGLGDPVNIEPINIRLHGITVTLTTTYRASATGIGVADGILVLYVRGDLLVEDTDPAAPIDAEEAVQ